MKFNKWTLGLAAVGAVSLVSAARAEEKAASPMVMTAVANTTIGGYVDTSIHWNPGTGNANVPGYAFNPATKADGFNLDAVLVRISKPLDESEWAAGYDIDLFAGQDAVQLGTGLGNNLIKQAYVTIRTPVGNGIDWKLGVFDNWIGYESTESPSNPNYTRSYGYTMEPTTFTGFTGTYKVADWLNFALGIADTTGPVINARANNPTFATVPGTATAASVGPKGESYKTYLGSVALTAPKSWGDFADSSVYAGFVNGWNTAGLGATTENYFIGASINTPVKGLRVGMSYDLLHRRDQNYYNVAQTEVRDAYADSVALYTSFAVPDTKWSFHSRAEYLWQNQSHAAIGGIPANGSIIGGPSQVIAFTETIQYDLWANVISRLELRWDHQAGDNGGLAAYGGSVSETPSAAAVAGGVPAANKHNYYTIAANLIYKF